jgi:DNA-binding CsgD family transcriptional regulator
MLFLPVDSVSGPVRIPNSYSSLTFEFSAGTGYRHPLYKTKLTGLNQMAGDWSNQSSLSYTRLPAGEYRLEIISMNINGLPGPQTEFPFIIRPPWYGSVVALILYGMLVIAFSLFMRVLFLRRLSHHKLRIEEQEVAKRQHEMLKAGQEVIRLRNEKLQAEINFKNIQLADFTMSIIKRNEQLIRVRDEFIRSSEKGAPALRASQEKIIRMLNSQLSSEDDWQTFETHFDQAHQDFINRLKVTYPHLTQSDLKLCAYLRLNISSKEIAHLLNISVRGVEVRRYRLRKRINISTEENLYEFLLKF